MRRMHMTPQSSPVSPELALPPADTKRWSPSRKAAVIAATRNGLISREEVCARYMMSDEELVAWERAFDQNGVPGLRTTRLQCYRYTHIPVSRRQHQPPTEEVQLRYRCPLAADAGIGPARAGGTRAGQSPDRAVSGPIPAISQMTCHSRSLTGHTDKRD